MIRKFITNNPLMAAIIGLIIFATIVWATEWQDYSALSGEPASGDDLLIRDVSDTPPADGVLKRLPWSDLETYIANGANYWTGSSQAYLPSEIVVNNESTLYNALSDVDDFIQMGELNPEFGVNDTTQGHLELFGNNSSSGGKITWYSGTTYQSEENYWTCQAIGEELQCGPESDNDLFIFGNGSGGPSFEMGASANPIITMDDTADSDFVFDLDGSNLDFKMGGVSLLDMDTTDIVPKVLIDSAYGVESIYMDGGILSSVHSISPVAVGDSGECTGFFIVNHVTVGDLRFDLPASSHCSTDVSMKHYLFVSNETNAAEKMQIHASGSDTLQRSGQPAGTYCDGTEMLECDGNESATVEVWGWPSTENVWLIDVRQGTCSCVDDEI